MNMKKVKRNNSLENDKTLNFFVYIATIIFSILFLFIGNKIATQNLTIFSNDDPNQTVIKARIEQITNRTSEEYSLGGSDMLENIKIMFKAKILNGAEKGETVIGIQSIDSLYSVAIPEVEQNDKILILNYAEEEQEEAEWHFLEFLRTDKLIIFAIIFVIALFLFGKMKGFNTILSLLFTCAAIFVVFIPSILSGKNIYISSIIICLYIIVMTYLIINGVNKKTFAATIGCFGGIIVSGVLTIIMDKVVRLTGYVDDESIYLTYISTEIPIDLKAIIFAAILIGAMGAIMDVSMSIASSLWEIKGESDSSCSFDVLFKSGMNIGRDIMGTMANTLILAYIGSSLSVVLILSAYSTSVMYLLNREMIVVEILQALIGSFGILFTMPLTSLICAVLYTKKNNKILF